MKRGEIVLFSCIRTLLALVFPGFVYGQTFDQLQAGARERCHSLIQQSFSKHRGISKPEHHSLFHLSSLDDWLDNVVDREGGYNSIVRMTDDGRRQLRDRSEKFISGAETQISSGSYSERQNEGSRARILTDQWRICVIDYVRTNSSSSVPRAVDRQIDGVSGANEDRMSSHASESSIALAQQNQAKGDEQARKKGRREHRPDLDAKECLQFNPNTRLIRNACSYQIEVSYCAHNPKEANNDNFDVTWAFSCTEGKGRFGASTLRPGKDLGGMFPHRTDGGVYVAACREVYPKDIKFTGNQIDYRCRPI